MQSLARAYDDAGGALERELASVRWRSPVPGGGTSEQRCLPARWPIRSAIWRARSAWRRSVSARGPRRRRRSRRRGATQPSDFALRLRLVRAMGDVADTQLAGALAEAARDRDPVVRVAAVAAAARVAGGAATVRAGASDADAGVRRAALAAAGSRPDGLELATQALGADAWPMVRHAAAEALARACAASTPRRAGRSSAPSAAAARRWPAPTRPKRSGARRWPRSATAPTCRWRPSLRFSPSRGSRSPCASWRRRWWPSTAAPRRPRALAATLDDTLGDPAADERTVGLAVACTRALARTGDTSRPVLEALGAAANEPLSPAVRAAAMDTIGRLCPDGAAPALHKGETRCGWSRAARGARGTGALPPIG